VTALSPSPTPVIGTDSHAIESLDSPTSGLPAGPRGQGPYVESGGAGLNICGVTAQADSPGSINVARPTPEGVDPLC